MSIFTFTGAGLLQGLVSPTARGYHGLGTTGVSSHISLGQVATGYHRGQLTHLPGTGSNRVPQGSAHTSLWDR